MEREKFDPSPPKNPLTNGQQNFVKVTASGVNTTTQNFIQIGSGVSVLRMRDFATLDTKWLGYIFGCSWEKATAETRAPILTQNTSYDAVPRKQCLLGVAKPKSKVSTPIFPQNRHFWDHLDGTIFSPENGFNIGPLESKRPLIVVVAQ